MFKNVTMKYKRADLGRISERNRYKYDAGIAFRVGGWNGHCIVPDVSSRHRLCIGELGELIDYNICRILNDAACGQSRWSAGIPLLCQTEFGLVNMKIM